MQGQENMMKSGSSHCNIDAVSLHSGCHSCRVWGAADIHAHHNIFVSPPKRASQGASQPLCTQGLSLSSSAPCLKGPARFLDTLLRVQQLFLLEHLTLEAA